MMATQPVLIIGSMGTTNHGETKECIINKSEDGVDSAKVSVHTPMVHEYGSRSYITKTL
jgi:hypothetical protein